MVQDPPSLAVDYDAVVEERLLTIFSVVNDWLKYAEAKNGGVLALAAGAAALSLPQLRDISDLPRLVLLVFTFAEMCLLASITIALVSFVPHTDLTVRLAERHDAPHPDDNLYFFGHLAKYDPPTLASAMRRRYASSENGEAGPSANQLDVSAQIVANARITLWKLRLFSIAVVGFAGSVGLFTLGVLVAQI